MDVNEQYQQDRARWLKENLRLEFRYWLCMVINVAQCLAMAYLVIKAS